MNIKQLQYAIRLAQIGSFSQTAEAMKITQPSLSKQILSLEKDLGVQLFDRSCTPIKLTAAGEYFIREAQQLVYKEDQLIKSMERYKNGEAGSITIGISPFRSLYLVPEILKKVKDAYPHIQVFLHETTSDQLRKDAAEGKYDFAIINLPVDESVLDVTPIEADELMLAVPNEMLDALPFDKNNLPAEINFSDCKELPFVVVGQTQEMRLLFEKLCAGADFIPQIAAEVVGLASAWALARAGIGAALLPKQFLQSEHFGGRLTLFAVKNQMYTRQPAIVTKRGQYLSEYAKYAIQLLAETK